MLLGDAVGRLSQICEGYKDSAVDISNNMEQLKNGIASFEACVPAVGIFSAGKSALFNMWLGQRLLPEDQEKTTALATELHYGPETKMTVFLPDGSFREVSRLPSNAEEANDEQIADGMYAVCTCPSQRLADLKKVVPVDMPGTDSGIKRHVDAFYRYVHRGVAFLLVIAAETGTLPASLKAVVGEIVAGGHPVILVMTKCDKRPAPALDAIQQELTDNLALIGCVPHAVIRCGRNDEEGLRALDKALHGLDVDRLCEIRFVPEAVGLCLRLRDHLLELQRSSALDTKELDERLRVYTRIGEKLEEELAAAEKRLSTSLRQTTLYQLDMDMRHELTLHTERLCDALMQGEEKFQLELVALINQVCQASLSRTLSEGMNDINMGLESIYKEVDPDKVAATLKTSALLAQNMLEKALEVFKKGKLYKFASTALAVFTSVITPILELVIIFLPEIIDLFYNTEERRRNAYRDALTQKIFPSVCCQLCKEVKEALPDMEREMIEELRETWRGRIKDNRAALEACRADKEKQQSDWNAKRLGLERDLKELDGIISGLSVLKG